MLDLSPFLRPSILSPNCDRADFPRREALSPLSSRWASALCLLAVGEPCSARVSRPRRFAGPQALLPEARLFRTAGLLAAVLAVAGPTRRAVCERLSYLIVANRLPMSGRRQNTLWRRFPALWRCQKRLPRRLFCPRDGNLLCREPDLRWRDGFLGREKAKLRGEGLSVERPRATCAGATIPRPARSLQRLWSWRYLKS